MAVFCVSAQDTARSGTAPTWHVQKYDLDVTLPADTSRTVPVKATISVKNVSSKPATTLTLRISPAAEITALKINNTLAEFTKSEETVAVRALQRTAIRLPSAAAGSIVTTSVEYKITLTDNTPVGSITPSVSLFAVGVLVSNFEQLVLRSRLGLGPCSDKGKCSGRAKPSSPPAPKPLSVLEQKLNGQPFFSPVPGRFRNRDRCFSLHAHRCWGRRAKARSELATLFSEARTFTTSMLGTAPDVPLRIVGSRRGAGFATGGTVLAKKRFPPIKDRFVNAMNIAEATAKLWIGNHVGVNGDGYGVVSEGLVRYIATQFFESKYGKDVVDIERSRQRNAYAAVSKRDAPMVLVSPIDDYYYPDVANKGAMAWRLIAKRVGAKDFGRVLPHGCRMEI